MTKLTIKDWESEIAFQDQQDLQEFRAFLKTIKN